MNLFHFSSSFCVATSVHLFYLVSNHLQEFFIKSPPKLVLLNQQYHLSSNQIELSLIYVSLLHKLSTKPSDRVSLWAKFKSLLKFHFADKTQTGL